MTQAGAGNAIGRRSGTLLWCSRNVHFLIVAVLLGVTAATWNVLSAQMGIWLIKDPVAWPEGVQVDEKFKLVSLPGQIGPYMLQRDMDHDLDNDTMELLKIGHSGDKKNRPSRTSNWLSHSIWRDSTVPDKTPFQYWRLEVYYYTGGADVVPHVGEICLAAGGADIEKIETTPVRLEASSAPPGHDAWAAKALSLRTLRYRMSGSENTRSSYYIFSLNGLPENERLDVRRKLINPFVRHAYFAKIQFEPLSATGESRQTDAAATRFAQAVLPQVLKVLPTVSEVERLDHKQ